MEIDENAVHKLAYLLPNDGIDENLIETSVVEMLRAFGEDPERGR